MKTMSDKYDEFMDNMVNHAKPMETYCAECEKTIVEPNWLTIFGRLYSAYTSLKLMWHIASHHPESIPEGEPMDPEKHLTYEYGAFIFDPDP